MVSCTACLRLGVRSLVLAAALMQSAQAERIYKVGGFAPVSKEGFARRADFREAMRELGYVEGRNVVYVSSSAGADRHRLAQAADELVALKPDVLIAWGSDAATLHKKTRSIPIVLTGGFDPVGAGVAQSLQRPGKNVTGVTQLNTDLPAKHIELLAEILPEAKRVGMLFDTHASGCALVERSARSAAQRLGWALVTYKVGGRAEIERAFAQMQTDRLDALLPCPSAVLYNHRAFLFSEGLRLRIPWTSFIVANLPNGVLFAYSSSRKDEYRKAAIYVDRILRGEKPADLPIEQPSRFYLVINMKTAKALEIVVPQSMLLRADQVIE